MNFDQYFFFRDYKNKWYLFLVDVFLLFLLGWIILALIDQLKNKYDIPPYIVSAPEIIRIAAFFSLLAVLFIGTKILFRWFVNQDKRGLTYTYKNQHWPDEWIFNGKSEPKSELDELFVKSSRAGILLKNYEWKNFRMVFEMKFETSRTRPNKNIGLVFRAEDLDNYFMLEIFQDNDFYEKENEETRVNKITGVKSHIRFHGGWELMDIEERKMNFSSFVNLCLEVKNDVVTFFYKDEQIFRWVLPTHVDVNHIEAGPKQKNDEVKQNIQSIFGNEVARYVREIPFRQKYGMIGFRAHPGQGAVIKNLKVEPL